MLVDAKVDAEVDVDEIAQFLHIESAATPQTLSRTIYASTVIA